MNWRVENNKTPQSGIGWLAANHGRLYCAMLDQERFTTLVGQTYDAAIGEEDWSVVVDHLLRTIGGVSASLLRRGGPTAGAFSVGFDPDCLRLYETHYHRVDPIQPALRRVPPASTFDARKLLGKQALEGSEFYNDFLVPWGMNEALFWHSEEPGGRMTTLKIVRSRHQPPFGDQEVSLMRALSPHLGRAQRIERSLRGITTRQPGSSTVLSRRERECLHAVAGGASSKAIAQRLAISAHTVNEYVESAMRKLGAVNRTEAVATALGLGLLEPEASVVQENR